MSEKIPLAVPVTDDERKLLVKCLQEFLSNFHQRVHQPATARLGLTPEPIERFYEDLSRLSNSVANEDHPLFREHLPVLKSALLYKLRIEAIKQEEKENRTPDKATKAALLAQIQPYLDLAASAWVEGTEAERTPILSDYLVISEIESLFSGRADLSPREYDEKFGILNAPRLFLKDLAFYRQECCELRGRLLSVGYIDIDDFKEFNTRLGEPRVDREVLPLFMRVLEAATYRHGYAYRYGGDEYVVLLPNRGLTDAVIFFHRLQGELEDAEYGDVHAKPTISVGVCEVRNDCPLTDRQVEQRAADAKSFAKKQGKNRVAGIECPWTHGEPQVFERP